MAYRSKEHSEFVRNLRRENFWWYLTYEWKHFRYRVLPSVRLFGIRWAYDNAYRRYCAGKRDRDRRKHSRNIGGFKARARVAERDGNKCAMCGTKKNLTLDHIVRVAVGGKDELDNWQLLCFQCHCEKDREVPEYALKRQSRNKI